MKKLILVLLISIVSFVGCMTRAPFKPPEGLLFSKYKAPLTVNYETTPVCQARGKATCHYVRIPFLFGIDFAWDDSTLKEAARNGNLKDVEYADYEILNVLGIYRRVTVNAYGTRQ